MSFEENLLFNKGSVNLVQNSASDTLGKTRNDGVTK